MSTLQLQLVRRDDAGWVMAGEAWVGIPDVHFGQTGVRFNGGRAWDHYWADLDQITPRAIGEWRSARVRLVVNDWWPPPVPLTWCDEPADLWTGMARWVDPGIGDRPRHMSWMLMARRAA